MAFNKYFHDELTALRELGKEFSIRNPRLAPFLSIEAQDPDVERLLEGFAFLTGRLRQKLDDELPEVTHSLMSLLWPGFLRPIPSMSILQFTPQPTLSEKKRVLKGVEIDSKPVDGTVCTFRTCDEVEMHPLRVDQLVQKERPTGHSLALRLGFTTSVRVQDLGLESVRIHLHGEVHVAQTLYLWLFRYLDTIIVKAKTEEGEQTLFELPPSVVKPVGFKDSQSLLPTSKHLFSGYRLLQEYFCLPEKFQFFDLTGLEKIGMAALQNSEVDSAEWLEFEFVFNRSFESHLKIRETNFRLHCVPVVNLFRHEAIPLRVDHRLTEYRVLPAAEHPIHYEIFSIDEVESWGHEDHHCQRYSKFESFEHAQMIDEGPKRTYYRERIRPAVSGYGVDTYMAFVNESEVSIIPQTETISIDLTCSNRHLPSLLNVGDICIDTGTSPEYATFENISHVTPTFTPPLDQGYHWRLISNMSLNYTSLTEMETLKTILSTYDHRVFFDRQHARASQHRLNGLDSIKAKPEERLYEGIPIRGIATELCMRESCFANEGDMYCFAVILNEFFSLFSTINSFHRLSVKGMEQGEIYTWTPRVGQQAVL